VIAPASACAAAGTKPLRRPLLVEREDTMADDLKDRGQRDRDRINVNEDYEVRYWSDKFGVSAEELKATVAPRRRQGRGRRSRAREIGLVVAYVVKWRSRDGIDAEFSFARKDDAIANARGAADQGATDLEVSDDGKPVPRSAYAAAGKAHRRTRRRARA
jgi:hypothetical protein